MKESEESGVLRQLLAFMKDNCILDSESSVSNSNTNAQPSLRGIDVKQLVGKTKLASADQAYIHEAVEFLMEKQ